MPRQFPLPPGGDPAFSPLADARMYWPVQRARVQVAVREAFQASVGIPIERGVFGLWKRGLPGSYRVEQWGLPRRIVEQALGEELILNINPRELIRIRDWQEMPKRQRPSSSAFIWDGYWDLRRGDLRHGSRYRFIRDIETHRHDLVNSETFRQLKQRLDEKRPWASHQQGLLLDSEARIIAYLRVYLAFMDDMAVHGFDGLRGKDELGVAVSREGKLIKINRGLHRLAMAQYLGLPSVPVKVKAVHRAWWEKVTEHTHGAEALERVVEALPHCVPETEPGPLDPHESPKHFTWP